MTRNLLTVWLVALVLLLAGCQTLSDKVPLLTKSAKEKEIATLRADFAAQMDAQNAEIARLKTSVIAAKDAQIRGGGNAFFAQDQLFKGILKPVRSDLIWHNLAVEGFRALGSPVPDYDTIVKINERLKTEMDEQATSLDQLQHNHEAALSENQKLVDATKAASDKLAQTEAAKAAAQTAYQGKLDKAQEALNAANDRVIQTEKARADDAAAIQAAKMKISMVCGALALLCVAGAIYSPVAKGGIAIFGAVCGLVSVGIWYLAAWHVAVAFGVVVVGVVVWALRKWHIESKTGTNVIRAVQQIKEKSREEYDRLIAPTLKVWNSTYGKDGKLVPDQAAIAHVDNVLRQAGDL